MILLVEDDPLVRELLQSFLESAGHQVVEAASAEQALRAVAEGPLDPQLVITDMDLPGIDGTELVTRLRATRPELKVLFMSGNPVEYPTDAVGQRQTASLTKPFTREMLMDRVRALLGGTAP